MEVSRERLQRLQSRIKLSVTAPRWDGIDGWLTPNEAFALYRYARYARRLHPDAVALEIGSWKGKSTYCIARGLRGGRLICIDPFDASAAGDEYGARVYAEHKGETPLRDQFERAMTEFGVRDYLDVRQGTSEQFVGTIGPLDLLFIDGDHSLDACTFDYTAYAPLLRPGGLLLFHDYYPALRDSGPRILIEETIVPSGAFHPVEQVDSLWVAVKPGA